jgi:hypothetical protein
MSFSQSGLFFLPGREPIRCLPEVLISEGVRVSPPVLGGGEEASLSLFLLTCELATEARTELHGFPRQAFKALTEAMGSWSRPRPWGSGRESLRPRAHLADLRRAGPAVTFGDWGMATYVIIDAPPIVRVVSITWAA